ncbi:TerB family tellurite resistance protein [Gammaproteobacteria bacterium]|nr:TerB family tellurite resistance protein [Gammaproteobacteria bacterium]MDB9859500.1 TerB family tellurite resistance protein [Gammaproteobacteria bacterium]MDB9940081.1 TerB family tellurite resistance protein [Gammaproteobacteria bacterium]
MMLNKLFRNNIKESKPQKDEVDAVLRLMFEIALSDGHLDKTELDILKKRAAEISLNKESTSDVIKKIIEETEGSSSLYPTIQKINAEFSIDQKKKILETLWLVVTADGMVSHYEENLYFRIAELLKIKRPHANQIKHDNKHI